jgi:hypothetical protein
MNRVKGEYWTYLLTMCRTKGGGDMKTIEAHINAVQVNMLPETGLVRLSQILGDKKKGIPPIIPVSKSAWWAGCHFQSRGKALS